MNMSKQEAIDVITEAAKIYQKYFEDKNLLIVYGNKNSNSLSYSDLSFYETIASRRNFTHLTGVLLNETNGIDTEFFYDKAIGKNNNRIFETDFNFRSDNTTFMKLDVIQTALNASENFELCGYFRNSSSHTDLDSDLLVGSRNSIVGFRSAGNMFVPNTLLKGDIRDETASVNSVLAVFQKGRNDNQYTNTVCFAPDVHAQNFLAELQKTLHHYNHQNVGQPVQINISLNSKQLENDRKIEQKAHITEVAGRLNTARKNHIRNSFDNTAGKVYSDTLNDLLDEVNHTELYGYTNILLKKQRQTVKGNEKAVSCIEKEREKIQNLHTLSDILKDLTDARTDYVRNPDSESSLDRYIAEQEELAERAVEADLHDYIIKLLQSQQQRGSPELASYIDDDIQVIHDKKLEYDTAPRKMNFSFSIRNNAFRLDNSDTVALEKAHKIAITIPPKRPFKALIIKAQKLFRNIADSLHGTEKQPDNAEQEERNTSVDKEEKSEKDEICRIELYGTSAVKWNGYIDFIGTDEALKEIRLQTGLLFEQKAVQEQEHLRPPEQVQVEMKKKSKQMEYGD